MKDIKLYKEEIMRQCHNERYRGSIEHPDFYSRDPEPSCGDWIIFEGRCNGPVITDIKYRGEGSILSQAIASMLCERCCNSAVTDALALGKDDLRAMLGIELGPTRMETVSNVLKSLQNGLKAYVESGKNT